MLQQKIGRTKCPIKVAISSDIGKFLSAIVRWPTVICSPESAIEIFKICDYCTLLLLLLLLLLNRLILCSHHLQWSRGQKTKDNQYSSFFSTTSCLCQLFMCVFRQFFSIKHESPNRKESLFSIHHHAQISLNLLFCGIPWTSSPIPLLTFCVAIRLRAVPL